jgi:hypothetical protein
MTTGNSKLTITNLDYKLMKACLHFHDCETRFQKKTTFTLPGTLGLSRRSLRVAVENPGTEQVHT